MRVGSLFSGIGGFDLGFERAGMETAFFVENEPYCQKVLAKHWPDVPIFNDVREVSAETLPAVDLLCGGFPCQDLSYAGKGAGIEGARSGLWSEFARLIRELRPSYVVVENVPALRSRGLWRVLGDLAESGYDAEWDCLPASAFGAAHRRDRLWLVAYPNRLDCEEGLGTLPHRTSPQRLRCDTQDPLPRDLFWVEGAPPYLRVVDGFPDRLERCRALGNALVPQIAEWIGRRILEYEGA